MNNKDKCIARVLRQGLDDWVQAAELASLVMETHQTKDYSTVKSISIDIIDLLLKNDLVIIGGIEADGFHPWNISASGTLSRIEQLWNELGKNPGLGEICWLCNTEKGNMFATKLELDLST